MANGIIGYNPETGRTAIEYNGVRFYTKDVSVIKMAQRGNVEGAALRWAGKTSTARALRRANEQAVKPLYPNVSKALFNKMFKQGKRERLGTSAPERLQFARKYKETTKEVNKYISDAVIDDMSLNTYMDRLPNDLQQRLRTVINEEIEKAYAAKGAVDDSDIEDIYDRVTMEIDDYLLENAADLDPDLITRIMDDIGAGREVSGLERY